MHATMFSTVKKEHVKFLLTAVTLLASWRMILNRCRIIDELVVVIYSIRTQQVRKFKHIKKYTCSLPGFRNNVSDVSIKRKTVADGDA